MTGLSAYQTEISEKMEVLQTLLTEYDDGRRKSFYCTAVNLLVLVDIREVMAQIAASTKPNAAIKDKAKAAARIFQAMADLRNIELVLRKKTIVKVL